VLEKIRKRLPLLQETPWRAATTRSFRDTQWVANRDLSSANASMEKRELSTCHFLMFSSLRRRSMSSTRCQVVFSVSSACGLERPQPA
jgi:hypothetical protein